MVCGIHPQTLRGWMKKGQFLRGDRNHRYCYESITIAEGKIKAKMVKRVIDAQDWKAAAHWLKQRAPDEWGDKKTIAVEDGRLASMDKVTLLKELRAQQQLLEDSIEADGVAVPPLELQPPEEDFSLAAEAGLFDDDPLDDEPDPSPLPKDDNGHVPEGVRARVRLHARRDREDEV